MLLDQISKIIDLCRKKGVTSLQIDGLSIQLGPEVPESPYKLKQKARELDAIKDPQQSAADLDSALFWSTPNTAGEAQ